VTRSPWLSTRQVFVLSGDARASIGRGDLRFRRTGIWEVSDAATVASEHANNERSVLEKYIMLDQGNEAG
jgi:hypothetical protein